MTNAELLEKIKAEIDKRYAEYREKMKTDDFTYYEGMADALDLFEQFIDTLEEDVFPCWKKIHTYTEEIREGDMEKMLLKLSIGKGKRETKVALPDKVVDTLETEKPISQKEDFEKEIADYWTTMGWSKVMTLAKFKVIARYFYGLGLGVNDKSEKPINQEGLEEEIQRFLSNATKMDKGEWKGKYPISEMGFSVVARHFAKWGAEHLKK